jgi:hypothetical protein
MRSISLALIPAALLAGCVSDGQLGDNGLVRFSQLVNFAETSDFSSPIALNSSVFVALQRPDSDIFFDPQSFPELNLAIEGENAESSVVLPLGFAQYATLFSEPGVYRMAANDKDVLLDAITVRVEEPASIRLANFARLSTTSISEPGCVRFEDISTDVPLELHPNQELELFVVPESEAGEPMLGLLGLSATADIELGLDSPLIGQGSSANALRIFPQLSELPDAQLNVAISEPNFDDLNVTIEAFSAALDVSCL